MNEEKMTLKESVRLTLRAWRFYWKNTPRFVLSTVLWALADAVSPYAVVWFSARLVAELSDARDPQALAVDVAWVLGVTALLTLVRSVLLHWKSVEREQLNWQLGHDCFMEKQMSMDYADEDSQQVYDLYNFIQQSESFCSGGNPNAVALLDSVSAAVFRILGGAVLSVGLFTAMVPAGPLTVFNSPLCVPAVLVLILAVAWLSPVCASSAGISSPDIEEEGRWGNRLWAFLTGVCRDDKKALDVRMYDQFEFLKDHAAVSMPAFERARKGKFGILNATGNAASALLMGLAYLFVCLKAYGGAFGLGAVTQYVGAATNFFVGIGGLFTAVGDCRFNAPYLKTLYDYLDLPNKMYKGSLTTEKRSDRQYTVEFRDVSFRYPGSEQYALRHLSMTFKVGERLAVVGMNGSGKTTFIKLLCRLYDPTEGVILLNGIDIRKYRYDEYMDIFSVVFQDFKLFALPLGQNVATAQHYDVARAADCLQKAGFSDRLARMPKGLDTCLYKDLDEDGVTISGGEAQKIAIARALYKDAPFIVLDEPTSFLDIRHKLELLTILKQMVLDHQLTVIMSLHELDLAQKISDKVICVHGEYIEKYGAPEEIFTSEYIRKLYGITRGSYNAAFGCVEMDPPRGEPQVFVIGGNGSGIPYYRKLQRQGIPFAAGVLHTNDVDCQVAGALADQVITEKPFESISQESYDKAVKLMKKCQKVICPLKDFGTVNAANRELLRLARELGILAEL